MRVLVVDAYPADHRHACVTQSAVDALEANGHEVELFAVLPVFDSTMSAAERAAYETDRPLLADETKAAAASIARCDALVFCYPTTLFGVPAALKSWLERVLVPGVGFVLDEQRRVRPGMTNVHRLGAITTCPHSRVRMWRAGDLGYRTLLRTLRLNCHRTCRRTYLRLDVTASATVSNERIARALQSWR